MTLQIHVITSMFLEMASVLKLKLKEYSVQYLKYFETLKTVH